MATRAPLAPPPNETESSVSRITREGKKLTYKLNVMQQPERARACGAGAKSSADRRPVDPPPVVELRVYESDPNDDLNKTDITFAYNANFFLYATLETARPMAQGRFAPNPTCPVLTGVPVAGVAYLDRPSQAGYFIFPDLSVRHEGVYRLNFHLYEETKESKDANENAPIQSSMSNAMPSKPMAPKSFLDFRLEVVSVPFTVFSAKKFPGLTTSTSLSRVIAEQGCRVRIRRDVRMRRRGEKRTDDYDYDEERVYRSSDRFSTPDTHGYAGTPVERPRSTSISTVDPSFPYGVDAQRRSSGATEYGFQGAQPYQRPMPPAPAPAPAAVSTPAPPAPPAPPSHNTGYQSHLSFGSTQTQYPAPQLPPTPQSTSTLAAPYSPHPSYSHARNPSTSAEYETTGYPYPPSRMSTERSSYPKNGLPPLRLEPPKPLNMSSSEPRSSDPNAYHSVAPSAAPRSQTPSSSLVPSLPPLKALSGDYPNNLSQPSSSISQSPSHDLGAGKKFLWDTGASLSKRSYEDSFGHDDRPLYNGMRPDTEGYPRRLSDAGRNFYTDSRDEMAYKRANGRMATKISPALQ
ncbi:velvet factor-domain-containing protein [Aspergillus pseudotamarii]|uniref:Developmental and secondary metabolism regulator veA n=1 Tax=Aspergillus pseudotamarii TaxID=132259 RepID=A0A5N6SKC6_ASPPS|nr:velvet factor-domain-containing protein [Aspergillus pseudotamarii]KAE8135146.1 velvet factor-domain-containing protein [Aspergillus pseudotamarii]